jgi:hypothetical protein
MNELIPLGTFVKVNLDLSRPDNKEGVGFDLAGIGKLYVVGYLSPKEEKSTLYVVSDIPVVYPVSTDFFDSEKVLYKSLSSIIEYCFPEDLQVIGKARFLYPKVKDWYSLALN